MTTELPGAEPGVGGIPSTPGFFVVGLSGENSCWGDGGVSAGQKITSTEMRDAFQVWARFCGATLMCNFEPICSTMIIFN